MAEILTALLTYGPLGIFCAVLWVSYSKKDEQLSKERVEYQTKITSLMESHAKTLDDLRKAQADREKEVSQTLQSYGSSVVNAVDQVHDVANKLWDIRK